MCQVQNRAQRAVSRRTVLKGLAGAAVVGAAALAGEELSKSPSTPLPKIANSLGEKPYSFAGHLHASFSENVGSNEAQAVQAKLCGLDSAAITEHDWRMLHEAGRSLFPFTSMSIRDETGTWDLARWQSGKLSSQSRGVTDVASTYPSGGALLMTATSDGGHAALGYDLECAKADYDYRGNVGGRTISVDAFAEQPSTPEGGYLAFVTELSKHPSISEQPLTVFWRLNTQATSKKYEVNGRLGYVEIPATVGQMQTITPDPAVDFPRLWPDIDPLDNSYFALMFVAGAAVTGATGRGWFSNLRFVLDPTYDASAAIGSQQSVAAKAFARYAPSVLLMPGCELSRGVHVRQLDGTIILGDYAPSPRPHLLEPVEFTTNMVSQIHQSQSTAVLCHPFGIEVAHPMYSQTQQDKRLAEVAVQLIASKAFGVDAIEAGYQARNGMDIEHHQMLWRVLSRQGHVLTADGVSDDHTGHDWASQVNRFVTYIWAKQLSSGNLSKALASGRAYVAELSSFSGQLDLWFDNLDVVMGQVSMNTSAGSSTRTLWVRADGLPSGAQVKVWRGLIDYADGAEASNGGVPNDGGVLVGGTPIAASKFQAGPVGFKVDTSSSCFYWVDISDSTGRTIAFSNMIYQLRHEPPSGAPSISSSRLITE